MFGWPNPTNGGFGHRSEVTGLSVDPDFSQCSHNLSEDGQLLLPFGSILSLAYEVASGDEERRRDL
jgi:hypothetical protein